MNLDYLKNCLDGSFRIPRENNHFISSAKQSSDINLLVQLSTSEVCVCVCVCVCVLEVQMVPMAQEIP